MEEVGREESFSDEREEEDGDEAEERESLGFLSLFFSLYWFCLFIKSIFEKFSKILIFETLFYKIPIFLHVF